MLPDIPFNDVNLDALKLLEEHDTPESRHLEYKEELPLDDKSQRREFCADVSAFANTDGGYLLVGIKDGKENEGKPIVRGIAEPPNTDGYISDLENIIKSGVEPNIHGINIKAIDLGESDESRIVLVISIPSSWSRPHWIGKEKSRSFCSRKSNGKYHLDITEVRQMFLLSETVPERIRGFRASRIAVINEGATPAFLHDGPKAVLHVVPLSAFGQHRQLDLQTLTHLNDGNTGRTDFIFRFNFDGIYRAPLETEGRYYYQVFRDGCVEFVECIGLNDDKEIHAPFMENFVYRDCLPRIVDWYDKLEITVPIFFMLTVVNVRGFKLVDNFYQGWSPFSGRIKGFDSWSARAIDDKTNLPTPEIMLSTQERDVDKLMQLLRPAFDVAWQSSGWPRSPGFNEDGTWRGWERN